MEWMKSQLISHLKHVTFDLQGNLLKEIRFPDKTISIAIKGQVILQIDGRMKRIFLP